MPVYRLAVQLTGSLVIGLLVACGSGGSEDAGLQARTPPATAPQSTGAARVCVAPIPAVTSARVTSARVEAAAAKMNELQLAADSGDEAAARAAFAGDTHNVTHDIDEPLRAADPELALELCQRVLAIEEQFARTPDLQAVAAEAGASGELLRESGHALGLSE